MARSSTEQQAKLIKSACFDAAVARSLHMTQEEACKQYTIDKEEGKGVLIQAPGRPFIQTPKGVNKR